MFLLWPAGRNNVITISAMGEVTQKEEKVELCNQENEIIKAKLDSWYPKQAMHKEEKLQIVDRALIYIYIIVNWDQLRLKVPLKLCKFDPGIHGMTIIVSLIYI